MKKEYSTPQYEVEKFTIQNIFTTSGEIETPDNPIVEF